MPHGWSIPHRAGRSNRSGYNVSQKPCLDRKINEYPADIGDGGNHDSSPLWNTRPRGRDTSTQALWKGRRQAQRLGKRIIFGWKPTIVVRVLVRVSEDEAGAIIRLQDGQ